MMDVKEKLVELKKVLRECLHFNYDEFSCDMSLDVDLTAENLIANGVTVQEWISVKDRLPHYNDGLVFVYVEYQGVRLAQWELVQDHPEWFTHWMPLPQPPKEDSDG